MRAELPFQLNVDFFECLFLIYFNIQFFNVDGMEKCIRKSCICLKERKIIRFSFRKTGETKHEDTERWGVTLSGGFQ